MAVFFIKYLRTLGFDVTNKEMEKPDIGGKSGHGESKSGRCGNVHN